MILWYRQFWNIKLCWNFRCIFDSAEFIIRHIFSGRAKPDRMCVNLVFPALPLLFTMNGSYSEFDLDIKNSHQQHDLRFIRHVCLSISIWPIYLKVRKLLSFVEKLRFNVHFSLKDHNGQKTSRQVFFRTWCNTKENLNFGSHIPKRAISFRLCRLWIIIWHLHNFMNFSNLGVQSLVKSCTSLCTSSSFWRLEMQITLGLCQFYLFSLSFLSRVFS